MTSEWDEQCEAAYAEKEAECVMLREEVAKWKAFAEANALLATLPTMAVEEPISRTRKSMEQYDQTIRVAQTVGVVAMACIVYLLIEWY